MEDLKCLICLEEAREARACPICAKLFCRECLERLENTADLSVTCPHCRFRSVTILGYVKLNFVENLRLEREQESAEWRRKLQSKESELNSLRLEKESERHALEKKVQEKDESYLKRENEIAKEIKERDEKYDALVTETAKRIDEKDEKYRKFTESTRKSRLPEHGLGDRR